MPGTHPKLSEYFSPKNQLEYAWTLLECGQLSEILQFLSSPFAPDLSSDAKLVHKLFRDFQLEVGKVSAGLLTESSTTINSEIIEGKNDIKLYLQIISKVPQLESLLYQWVDDTLVNYISLNQSKLFPNMDCAFEQILGLGYVTRTLEVDPTPDANKITLLLNILESECLYGGDRGDEPRADRALDSMLVPLLFCDVDSISSICSKLMRWRSRRICQACREDPNFDIFVFNCIKSVSLSESSQNLSNKRSHMLSLLLRLLSEMTPSSALLEYIATDQYWKELQLSLSHTVHEYRKLALSVLKLTIKCLIDVKLHIETSLFEWKPEMESNVAVSWRKLITIYEMVALDTALNQIQAARKDILSLASDPYIHPSWFMIIFSTGLSASMESVRRYMLTLSFEVEDSSVFCSNLDILRNSILHSAMEAHYFSVSETDLNCAFGERVTDFVYRILTQAKDQLPGAIDTILQLLIIKGASFDPAKIYVSYGILKYLEMSSPQNSQILNQQHLEKIRKLFEFEGEEEVFETTMVTILIKFLLYVNPESVSYLEWIETVKIHLICLNTDFKYLNAGRTLADLRDVARRLYTRHAADIETQMPSVQDDPLTAVLQYLMLDIKPNKLTPAFVSLLVHSTPQFNNHEELKEYIVSTLNQINSDSNSLSDEEYPLLKDMLTILKDDLKTLQRLLDLGTFYRQNLAGEVSSFNKFEFFVGAYQMLLEGNNGHIGEIMSSNEYTELYQALNRSISKEIPFKVIDHAFGNYFTLLLSHLKHMDSVSTYTLLKPLELSLHNIEHANIGFETNLAISKLCIYILDHNNVAFHEHNGIDSLIDMIFRIISQIWQNVSEERLILKEKELHLNMIYIILHPLVLELACDNESDDQMRDQISAYGKAIADYGYSKRTFLPLASRQILRFCKQRKPTTGTDYRWLIDVILAIFTQPRMDHNIFKLKPVIAHLYDEKLSAESSNGMTGGLYERAYGEAEISAKVHLIEGILVLNDSSFRKQVIDTILHDTNFLTSKKRIDGPEEVERTLLSQLLLLCVHLLANDVTALGICEANRSIIESLEVEASPLVRIYKEWIIAYLIAAKIGVETEEKQYEIDTLFSLLKAHDKPVLVVSAEKILFLVLKARSSLVPSLLERFVCSLVVNCTTNKPLVRHFSNSLMLSFWPSFKDTSEGNRELAGILRELYENARSVEVVGQYRAGDANIWDLFGDLKLSNIFGGVLKKILDHEVSYIPVETFHKFLTTPESCLSVAIGEDESSMWLKRREGGFSVSASKTANIAYNTTSSSSSPSSSSSILQTKSGAWETVMDPYAKKKAKEHVNRSDLIVVASLVDRPPNLGGICRLCDVLGVGLMTVQDIKVKNHSQFKNVVVTADRWMPMEEVKVDEIAEYMRRKKRQGYTLIGLEQTDKSVKLDNNFRFPKKSLILLGTEAQGIPGDLLGELDLCLEIQQYGVIRSMNIQTATAVIVHSYAVQHLGQSTGK